MASHLVTLRYITFGHLATYVHMATFGHLATGVRVVTFGHLAAGVHVGGGPRAGGGRVPRTRLRGGHGCRGGGHTPMCGPAAHGHCHHGVHIRHHRRPPAGR
eukprot:1063087-Prorocentrum_minimum.AAC.2